MFLHVCDVEPIDLNTVTVEGKRYYETPTGGRYPSITTVISNNSKKQAGLAKWRNRVGKDKASQITTRSTKRGTKYHSIVEDYLNNKLDREIGKDHPLSWMMFDTSIKFLNNINNIYLQEDALYSDVLQIAGRVDCIAEYEGKLSVVDFKTSAKPKPEYQLYDYYVQETAYACCFKELYGLNAEQLVTLISCESGDVQVVIKPIKKEYLIRLQEYLTEYREKHARKIIVIL